MPRWWTWQEFLSPAMVLGLVRTALSGFSPFAWSLCLCPISLQTPDPQQSLSVIRCHLAPSSWFGCKRRLHLHAEVHQTKGGEARRDREGKRNDCQSAVSIPAPQAGNSSPS